MCGECVLENFFSCPNNSMCCIKYIYKYDYISGECMWESDGVCDLNTPFKNARRYDGHVYCDTGYFVECGIGDSEPCGYKLPFNSTTCECIPVKVNEHKFDEIEYNLDETNLEIDMPKKGINLNFLIGTICVVLVIVASFIKKYKNKKTNEDQIVNTL